MENKKIIAILLITLPLMFRFIPNLSSLIPSAKEPVSEEVKALAEEMSQHIENKKDAIIIGAIYKTTANLFATDNAREDGPFYRTEEDIKEGVLNTEQAFLLYKNIHMGQKYPGLAKFISDMALEKMSEDEFTKRDATEFLRKVGESLFYLGS